jgi:hypothetical protein
MDIGQYLHRSAEQSRAYQKHVETYTTPEQNFTEPCRSPVKNISKGSDHHAVYMMISH